MGDTVNSHSDKEIRTTTAPLHHMAERPPTSSLPRPGSRRSSRRPPRTPVVFSNYQKAMKRRDRLSGEYLAAFDAALQWAGNGHTTGTEGNNGDAEVMPEFLREAPKSA
jgi:hypothetical protein